MYFKKIVSLIITGAIVLSLNGVALAEFFSVSVGAPVYQNFNDGEAKSDGMPVGFLAHVKFPIMVGAGIESYQTKVDADDKDITVKTNMFDVFYLLPVPVINITLGLGAGNINLDSDSFEDNAFAYQGWLQVGFPFFPFLDAHVSYHKIFATVESKQAGVSDKKLDSDMVALGVAFIF